MNTRALRLALDGGFLVLAFTWMLQDWQHHSGAAAAFWGVLTLFWVAMLVVDFRRPDPALAHVDRR